MKTASHFLSLIKRIVTYVSLFTKCDSFMNKAILRKDSIAKFRKYHLKIHFLEDSQNMSILKILKTVTVNNPAEINQRFPSYLSKTVSFSHQIRSDQSLSRV